MSNRVVLCKGAGGAVDSSDLCAMSSSAYAWPASVLLVWFSSVRERENYAEKGGIGVVLYRQVAELYGHSLPWNGSDCAFLCACNFPNTVFVWPGGGGLVASAQCCCLMQYCRCSSCSKAVTEHCSRSAADRRCLARTQFACVAAHVW